jgi:hypothetical protein
MQNDLLTIANLSLVLMRIAVGSLLLTGYWPMMENSSAQGIAAFMTRTAGKWRGVVKTVKTFWSSIFQKNDFLKIRDAEYMVVHPLLQSSAIGRLI